MTVQAFLVEGPQFSHRAEKDVPTNFLLECAKKFCLWLRLLVTALAGEKIAWSWYLLSVLSSSESVVDVAAVYTSSSHLPSWPPHLRAEWPSHFRLLQGVHTADNISTSDSTEGLHVSFTEARLTRSICRSAGAGDIDRCVREANTQTRIDAQGRPLRAKAVGNFQKAKLNRELDRKAEYMIYAGLLLQSARSYGDDALQVIPIPANASVEHYRKLFLSIDGLLLPGGSAAIHSREAPYYKAAKLFLDWAAEANESGRYFPVFGICLGFEAMVIWAGRDNFTYFTDEDYRNLDHTRQLHFLPAARSSKLFGPYPSATPGSTATTQDNYEPAHYRHMRSQAPAKHNSSLSKTRSFSAKSGGAPSRSTASAPRRQRLDHRTHDTRALALEEMVEASVGDVIDKDMLTDLLSTKKTAYFHHTYRITRAEFERDTILSQRFALLATCRVPKKGPTKGGADSDDEFVAIIESTRYPFYGFQFHPEKNLFEHSPSSNIPHDASSRWVAVSLGLFFANEVGRSRRKHTPFPEEWFHLIGRFRPTDLSSPYVPYVFEEAYFFDVANKDTRENGSVFTAR